eukprot:gene36728-49512_t
MRRDRRLGDDRILTGTRHAQRCGMQQHRRTALAIDRIADHRDAQRLGGMDADLVRPSGLGPELDQRTAVLDRQQAPSRPCRLAGRVPAHAPTLFARADLGQREARNSFGSDAVLIEKYVQRPRHIEIQVFGDTHGNCVYLFERDCSVQRRHQKDGEFFFIEMNTRLQVEHPVTEAITGVDLVREQIRIAAGLPLSFTQDDIHFEGHAIEVRINAENSETFAPSPGTVTDFHAPGGLGVRLDSAIYAGYSIPPYYDSLIGKLIVHGRDRDECIARLNRCLGEIVVG